MISTTMFWIMVACGCLLLELAGPGFFFFLSFFFGAVAASIASYLCLSWFLQLVSAFIGYIGSFFVLMVWLKHAQYSTPFHGYKSNVDALSGKRGLVIQAVTSTSGLVKIGGELWQARVHGNDEHAIASGEMIEVIRVKGCTLIVKAL